MSLLAKLKAAKVADTTKVAEVKDTVGGGSFLLPSDAYKMTIDLAYISTSPATGAMALNLRCSNADRKFRTTEWMISGDAKGNKSYYTNAKGEAIELPGFTIANDIAVAVTGKGILDLEDTERVIPLYNRDLNADVNTPVPAIEALIGQEIVLGIHLCDISVTVKDNSGKYVPTADVKQENQVNKVFNADGLTQVEVKAGLDEPAFLNVWLDKFKDQVINRKDRNAPKAGTAPAASGGQAPKAKPSSLFS